MGVYYLVWIFTTSTNAYFIIYIVHVHMFWHINTSFTAMPRDKATFGFKIQQEDPND